MKRLVLLLSLLSVAAPVVPAVYAASQNIEATATFTTALTLGNEQSLDFSTVQLASAPGAGDTVSLGSNGSIVYAGIFSGGGSGTAGSVDITAGGNGQVIEVFCDASAILSNGAGGSIAAAMEVTPENAQGAFGSGHRCNGVSGAAAGALVLGVGTLDTFKFGGQLDGTTATGFTTGSYSTANPGGNNVQVDMFYQ